MIDLFRNTKRGRFMQYKRELTPQQKFEKMLEKWKKQVNDKENDIQKRNNRKRK